MAAGFGLNAWIKAVIVVAVGVAIIFRVPMIERVVIGSNTVRQ